MKSKIKIEYLKESEIKPYSKNAKLHPQSQIDTIKNSMKEFGVVNPMGIDSDGYLIFGHGRFEAMKQLGHKEFPVYRVEHLSKEQVKMLRLADNKVAESEWDLELLDEELSELNDLFELDDFGFDFEVPNDYDEDEADTVPEVEENPCIKLGDLIELGEHRLLCGDSTKEEDVARLMDGKKADMVFTDPPYGVSYSNNMNDKHEVMKNDDVFLIEWIPLALKYSDGFFMMWTSYQVIDTWMKILKEKIGKITNIIIWHKGGGGLGDLLGSLSTDFETALVLNRGHNIKSIRSGSVWDFKKDKRKKLLEKIKKNELITILDNVIDGDVIWRIKKDNGINYMHPTQKPVELAERALNTFTTNSEIVMDLFLGSGSTLIACENLSRKCYGMELDEKYAQVIIQRYCDYTGVDTIKINGEEYRWSEYKESNKRRLNEKTR